MSRRCILFLLLFCSLNLLEAQVPENIFVRNMGDNELRSSMDCPDHFAGNISLGTVNAQSNDIDLEVSYLCFGDIMNIQNSNSNLTGDPEPSTDPGIGYAFYDCPPTVTGPTKADIEADPCLNTTDPIFVNGVALNLTNGMWVARDQQFGNIQLENTGVLQEAYNNFAPVQLWFAPITLDEFANGGFEDNGSCVNVNAAEWFSVVYLNEIEANNIQTSVNGNGCVGSFVVTGGLPEFDGLTYSDISIYLTSNPAITGLLSTGTALHGEEVMFSIPQPGEYTIEVTDGKSCMRTFTMDMASCSSISLTASDITGNVGDVVCFDIGTENFTGVGSLQFSFAYDQSILQYNSAGNFNLTGLDASGIANPNPGQVTFSWLDPYFVGVTLPDGTSIFELCFTILAETAGTNLSFTGIPAIIEAVDANGNPIGITLNDGTLTTDTNMALNVDVTVDSVSCGGLSDGMISLLVTGGTPPYSYNWEEVGGTPNGPINIASSGSVSTINALSAGTYSFTLTDQTVPPEQVIQTVEVFEEPPIFINITGTNPTCPGDTDGTFEITSLGGGTGNPNNFDIEWSTGDINTQMITGLGQGGYSVTVTDLAGCTQISSNSIGVNLIDIVATTLDHVTCDGNGADGVIVVEANGGTGAISFEWDTGVTGTTITDLIPAGYSVTATDANNCSFNETFTINPPEVPVITEFLNSTVSCANSTDGSLTVVATPANSPIATYTWSPDVGTTSTVNNLSPGTYYVTVTAEDGCVARDSSEVLAPDPLIIADTTLQIPTCPGQDIVATGLIGITVSGGTGPYSYFWSNNTTNPTVPALYGDSTYTVTITDANLCPPLIADIYLPNPPSIILTTANTEITSCASGVCDGEATVIASSGTGNGTYTFQWPSGNEESGTSTSTDVQLCAGPNVIAVNDGACTVYDTIMIGSPTPVTVPAANVEEYIPNCFGLSNGSLTVNAVGGTPPYDYVWSTTETGNTAVDLAAGTYVVTIVDDNNCNTSLTIDLPEPDPLVVTIDPDEENTHDVTCFGEADGMIGLLIDGAAEGALMYDWTDNVSEEESAINLEPGVYSVTVTDAKLCMDSATYVISEPTPIVPFIPVPEEPTCFGDRTVITVDSAVGGGIGIYSFSVNGGPPQSLGNLVRVNGGREHTIKVLISPGNCFVEETIFINQPAEVVVDLGPDLEIQLGDSIQLQPSLFVPLSIDTIAWSPTTDMYCNSEDCLRPWVSPLDTREYTLQVRDSDGCIGEDAIIVDVDKNRNVYVPNIFSPNGDGFNDFFRIHVGPGVTNVDFFQVYGRWGGLLYENRNFYPTDNESFGWDGKFNGKVMNPGTYVYLIKVVFDDGLELLYRGDISIVY